MHFTKNPKQASHLMLDGGMFNFANAAEEDSFLVAYAKEMEMTLYGNPHFYVERKTPVFWFFMELDYISSAELTSDEVDRIAVFCQHIVSNCFHKQLQPGKCAYDTSVAVYRAAAKVMPDEGGVKSGIHLIWRFPVNINTAWQLRRVILDSIAKTDSTNSTQLPVPTICWGDVLDCCVYKENGLRMVGSRKTEVCSECKGRVTNDIKKGNSCAMCQTTGKVDAGRPYTFYKSFATTGEMDLAHTEMYTQSIMNAVIRGSIRCNATIKAWPIDWENSHFMKDEVKKTSDADRHTSQLPQHHNHTRKRIDQGQLDVNTINLTNSPAEKERFRPLIDFIAGHFPGNPIATKVVQISDSDNPMFLVNTNSQWCANNNGNHTSSKIYFVVRANGVQQRCYCLNSKIHQPSGVTCSQFHGRLTPLSKDLVGMYFTKNIATKTLTLNGKRAGDEIDPVSTEHGQKRKTFKTKPMSPTIKTTLNDLLLKTKTSAFLQPKHCQKPKHR